MVKSLDLKYLIPSDRYYADAVIPQLYELTQQEVDAKISAADSI